MRTFRPEAWLPTTKKEVEAREWDYIDVILFSGDAYVDHPSFGAAVIGRTLEAMGLRVAIVPQPDWRGDYRDFKKLGAPRLFFGVSAGAMDSMINHYTANKRLRSDDAYTPDRRAGMRPDYPSIVYTKILKEIYPDVPVVLGGIEASLRRVTHYDYWQDKLLPGILKDSPADLLIYGMGELPLKELVSRLQAGTPFREIKDIRQTAYLADTVEPLPDDINLFSHEECLRDKLKQAKNFRHIEEESNKQQASRILQKVGRQTIVVNPPFPPMTEEEIDASFDLPYTRLPHPKYDTGFRDDQVLGKYPPGMFRRLCFLHHLGTSGEVHRFAKQRVDTERSEEDYADAGLQRISERSRRSFGQYVPDERKESGYLRPVQEAVMHLSCRLQEPECRSYAAVRDIQRSG